MKEMEGDSRYLEGGEIIILLSFAPCRSSTFASAATWSPPATACLGLPMYHYILTRCFTGPVWSWWALSSSWPAKPPLGFDCFRLGRRGFDECMLTAFCREVLVPHGMLVRYHIRLVFLCFPFFFLFFLFTDIVFCTCVFHLSIYFIFLSFQKELPP